MTDPVRETQAALNMALQMYEHGGRRTGRTAAMIAQLKPGDRVIVHTRQAEKWMKQRLRDEGLFDVTVIGADALRPLREHAALGQARQPTALDHSWVLARFAEAIDREAANIRRDVDHIQGVDLGLPRWPDTQWKRTDDLYAGEPENDGSWAWNWWEVVAYWLSGEPARVPFSKPNRPCLPFILPIITSPLTLPMDRHLRASARAIAAHAKGNAQ